MFAYAFILWGAKSATCDVPANIAVIRRRRTKLGIGFWKQLISKEGEYEIEPRNKHSVYMQLRIKVKTQRKETTMISL